MHPTVLISLSSFGASEVRRHGQAWFAALSADAGADGVEVRGELLTQPERELPALAALARQRHLGLVYSSPDGLFAAGGRFDAAALQRAAGHARQLGAARLKVSIGAFQADSDIAPLLRALADLEPELLIENDQTPSAGRLPSLLSFLSTAEMSGRQLGLTFDMGNWHWAGEEPLHCALALTRRVRYIHCKGVHRAPRQWVAVPLAESQAPWRAILRALPADVPRAIEYPLQGEDLLAVTRAEVALVREAEVQQRAERRAAPKPDRIPSGDRPTYPSDEGLS